MKKYLSVLLAVVVLFACAATAFAEASTLSANTPVTTLTISGTTATCKSCYRVDNLETKVVVTQTLKKQGLLGTWSTIDSWERTYFYVNSITFTNKAYDLESGKYRVTTDLEVTVDGVTTSFQSKSSIVEL